MGFIKKVFSGIFGFLGGILKIFGIGQSGYYMEVESSAPPTPAEPPKPAASAPAAPAPAAPVVPVAPVAAVEMPPAPKPAPAKPAPVMDTFATKFLIPTSSGKRRRPGPSLSPFMDMARKVKTPMA
jgi:hypothetical protein